MKFSKLYENILIVNIKTPEDLFSWMSENIKYSWTGIDGKIRKDNTDFFQQYRLQSPQELIESKLGVCWDQVELERYFFKKFDIKHKTIFIVKPNKYAASHSFLIYLKDRDIFYFEHAFGDYKGIHGPFKTNKEIIELVNKYMTINDRKIDKNEVTNKFEYSYYTQPKYGISCLEFYKHVGFGKYVK